ncbi:putative DNA methylase [Thioalkalivibrio nitratireducens DSM 14787]|uniref:site-specific DNA-methyltransferase (adenine-specific) n=1 Tax=Thioalkalivibrio nitratireducens (strain DSM 14787 / UNIQEM 213 / ALEN2) TaxID=1255043 RepID=L0E0W7_THIND|nr:site-specific DNA-methyltransferase [Thioalkalivibrio nitratireducens]AGA34928.1 putative DNA methylase [Thioalkalivibrio nitratireducens DSM 14787]
MPETLNRIQETLLALLPEDGSSIGNMAARQRLSETLGEDVSGADYEAARHALLRDGRIGKGRGRGGSIHRIQHATHGDTEFSLRTLEAPGPAAPKPPGGQSPRTERAPCGARGLSNQVLSYRHDDKRKNNPHVGMVDTHSDGVEERKTWRYDPHLAPELQFDVGRAQIERIIDDALASGEPEQMQAALEELKRLQSPFLNWAGKAERTAFTVDTVSLHVHERIDPATILAALQKRLRDSKGKAAPAFQPDLFHAPFENLPLRDAIDFYKHDRDWANRLITGDSLLVMNSLLQKEGMAGQVQMIYIDPPYGIKYGSNFQPFVNKRDVKDRNDADLTQEPEMIKAFRDTWELGIHSYLTYLRDRLLLARELLHESGSVFVQISDENLHHVREIMDEVFGEDNCSGVIPFLTTTSQSAVGIGSVADYLIWYSKNRGVLKYRQLYLNKVTAATGGWALNHARFDGYVLRPLTRHERKHRDRLPTNVSLYRLDNLTSQGVTPTGTVRFSFHGQHFHPGDRNHWKTTISGMRFLAKAGRLQQSTNSVQYVRYFDDFPVQPITNVWSDVTQAGFVDEKSYVVQTITKVIERCVLMTTDPGDLVLDPTCGSGTTAFVAEKWGRRWITCDTSRVSVTLAKQRLMTASYDYYELKHPHEGLRGGFIYKTVPHVTLKSIANNPEIDEIHARMHPAVVQALDELNAALKGKAPRFKVTEGGRKGTQVDFSAPASATVELPSGEQVAANALLEWEVPFDFPPDWPEAARTVFDGFHAARRAMQRAMDASIAAHAGQEVLYDQTDVSRQKLRISGPFTVEAVPFATVLGLDEAERPREADVAVARSGATSRQKVWREELLKAGIRGKGGQKLRLMDLDTLPGTHYIHAVGTVADTGERVAVSFGPEHAALEQRQVEIAMREAGELFPLPRLLVFCAFTFDPEAAKDIDNIKGIQALKVQMNTDLLTEDLKKARAGNESFWLMGQPDVEVRTLKDGQLQVEVHGFDYFDTKTGELRSGGKKNIALWELDTDYDNRSLYPRQVFFPMAGGKEGWFKLRKDIRAELNEDLLERFHGTKSLPFVPGDNRCIAVKIVDDRGIESLRVIRLDATTGDGP